MVMWYSISFFFFKQKTAYELRIIVWSSVVCSADLPVGSCQLSWILRPPRDIAIGDVMKREQTLIPVDMDQEEVALRFQKYALISAAVVDKAGRLVGMITVDDIVHIIQEEAGEDILRLSGAGDGDLNRSEEQPSESQSLTR